MKDTVSDWFDQVWSALEAVPGASAALADERKRWEKFRETDTLEVVVFGAYDAGKSSLLKRLFVDWRLSIPEWLTVSGRRETFESKRAETNGIGFTDTPGLDSGNDEHDDLTLSAMRLADAYLWVLPPQLVTTRKERLFDVLFGDFGIAESTIAVVARMDEAGVDPGEDETEFAALCTRKKEELSSILTAASTSQNLEQVHCVVADPYQMVGNMQNPEPACYDVGRSWDGMESLAREILKLKERRRNLRQLAGFRYARLLLNEACDELQSHANDLTMSKDSMDNEIKRYEVYTQRLDALRQQARAELHRRIEDALLSASRTGNAKVDSIAYLEESLTKMIDQWGEDSFAKYRKLVGELELEVRERMVGPSMDGFRRLAQEVDEQAANSKTTKADLRKTGRKALAFGPTIRKAFEKYAAAELGMSLKVASDRLQKLESSGETVEAFIKSQGRRGAFRSAEHAKKASSFVKWANVLEVVGPLVEQLGSTLFDVADEAMAAKRADERAAQRSELRRQLRDEAQKVEEGAAADFDCTCDGAQEWLDQRRSVMGEASSQLANQIEQCKTLQNRLNRLLETCRVGNLVG